MPWKKITSTLLILTIIGLLLAPHDLDSLSNATSETRGDAAHFPAFLLLALLFFFLLPPKHSCKFRLITSAIITTSLALGTEWLQSFTPGRMASLHDLIANGLGIAAAISGLWIWKIHAPPGFSWQKKLHLVTTCLIAAALTWPYARHISARLQTQKQFPLLSDFNNSDFVYLWKTQNEAQASLSSQTPASLEITLPAQSDFPGINYLPGPQDWSPYHSLHLTLINHGSAFQLGIRIDDGGDCSQLNSRFNDQRQLNPGENHIIIDLQHIHQSPNPPKTGN
ncbi:MAG: VanZ family protein [Verrucomicrobiota bacterium]